jgi:hypothetical protein
MSWVTSNITINDFKGELKLPFANPDIAQLDDVSEAVVNEFMLKLLGVELFEEFMADMENETPEARWSDLWNGKTYTQTLTGHVVKFDGCKKFMVQLIWSEMKAKSTSTEVNGDYNDDISNANKASSLVTNRYVLTIFNKAVVNYGGAFAFMKNSLQSGSLDYDGIQFQEISVKPNII